MRRCGIRVHQSLATCCLDGGDGTLAIVHLASVPNEVELPQVAVQVFLADVMIRPDDAALHQCKTAFHSIRVDGAASVFLDAVFDGHVTATKLLAYALISRVLIRHDVRARVYHLANRGLQCLARHVSDYMPPNLTAALYRCKHRSLAVGLVSATVHWGLPVPSLKARLATNVGFVNLDDASQWRGYW